MRKVELDDNAVLTPAGADIPLDVLDLYTRIKGIEEPDGSWPGGDVVDVLTGWFALYGIDVEAPESDYIRSKDETEQ